MGVDEYAFRLARHIAEAADAWLTDPLDGQVYERLVDATLQWRAYRNPMLEGTESVGRRTTPPPPPPPPVPGEAPVDTVPGRAPRSIGDIVGSADARQVLLRLSGRALVAADLGAGHSGEVTEQSPASEPPPADELPATGASTQQGEL